jgi:hypothetical protein
MMKKCYTLPTLEMPDVLSAARAELSLPKFMFLKTQENMIGSQLLVKLFLTARSWETSATLEDLVTTDTRTKSI